MGKTVRKQKKNHRGKTKPYSSQRVVTKIKPNFSGFNRNQPDLTGIANFHSCSYIRASYIFPLEDFCFRFIFFFRVQFFRGGLFYPAYTRLLKILDDVLKTITTYYLRFEFVCSANVVGRRRRCGFCVFRR